jgi:hypothetical protein
LDENRKVKVNAKTILDRKLKKKENKVVIIGLIKWFYLFDEYTT